MKTGFFSALWGVCCGTSIFPRLIGNSRARVVWHLFLMSLLCTVLVSLRRFPDIRNDFGGLAKRYVTVFGRQVELSESGILPELDPDKPRSMVLPLSGSLIYTAREKSIAIPPGALSTANYLVVWSDRFISIAVRTGEDKWDIQLMRPGQTTETVRNIERGAVSGYYDEELKRLPAADQKWKLSEFQVAAEEIFHLASQLFSAVWFIGDWLGNFALGLLCTGLFAGLSRLTGATKARNLSSWEYWKIGVYAGFPGMIIGSVATALKLPWLTYNIAYMLSLVVYWLPAALACSPEANERDGAAPPEV